MAKEREGERERRGGGITLELGRTGVRSLFDTLTPNNQNKRKYSRKEACYAWRCPFLAHDTDRLCRWTSGRNTVVARELTSWRYRMRAISLQSELAFNTFSGTDFVIPLPLMHATHSHYNVYCPRWHVLVRSTICLVVRVMLFLIPISIWSRSAVRNLSTKKSLKLRLGPTRVSLSLHARYRFPPPPRSAALTRHGTARN